MKFYEPDYSFRNKNYLETGRLKPTLNAADKASCVLSDEWEIILPADPTRLSKYYSYDLFRFISDAFGICLKIRYTEQYADFLNEPYHKIILITEKNISDSPVTSDQDGAFHISISDNSIIITGKTERGTAQGVYYIEDHMQLRGEAALKTEHEEHAPLFSPRMTHSGFELDTFSDQFLEACAHAGMDSIIVYAGHPDTNLHGFDDPDPLWPDSKMGYCDFNNLAWRAEGYGLDVYIYSHIKCDVYPDDPEAFAYYESSFGTLFRNCPKLKGIIFVGETFEFPSKDPHTCGIRYQFKPADEKRPTPGWYPCFDYPKLLSMIKKVINQYVPNADIIFWSYNWGWAPKEARLALIEALPDDITLLVTYEMWEYLKDDVYDMEYKIADYSISFVGPSQVFVDEAEKAKELGVRLYAMGNTGGRTWDNGSVPYIPVPQQWQKRYEALCKAKELYGLSGLMENHHYGWMPSFLSLFSKNAFTSNTMSNEEMLTAIAKRDFGEHYKSVLCAWDHFSQGISNVVACVTDQSGPFRCGPTYPLIFTQKKEDIKIISVPWAWHPGGGIWKPIYNDTVFGDPTNSLMRLRHIRVVVEQFRKGMEILDSVADKMNIAYGSEVSKQIATARYLYCSYVTAKHVMEWNIAKNVLFSICENHPYECVNELIEALSISECSKNAVGDYMKMIASAEKDNVMTALDCRCEDSRIGFEASMEYAFNDKIAMWKIAETDISLNLLEQYLSNY